MPSGADALHQRFRIHALDRILASRIDRRDHHRVGVVETGRKITEQVVQARVAVRLRDGDHPAPGGVAGRAQHGLDLHRMVAVVVEYLDAVP